MKSPLRTGGQVPQNVYDADGVPIAQFHDEDTAAAVVHAVNSHARILELSAEFHGYLQEAVIPPWLPASVADGVCGADYALGSDSTLVAVNHQLDAALTGPDHQPGFRVERVPGQPWRIRPLVPDLGDKGT